MNASHKATLRSITPCFSTAYDISLLLGETAPYPGDTPFSRETTSNIASGNDCDLSTLVLSAHAGTHLDAPSHFIAGGKTLDQYPLERFILSACVVSVDDEASIERDALEDIDLERGEALLFKTRNSLSGLAKSEAFSQDFVYLSYDAGRLCLDLGVSLVGIDYLSIDRFGDSRSPVHRLLLANDILILEGINLIDVPPGKYTLLCTPLRIRGAEAAPARAILAR